MDLILISYTQQMIIFVDNNRSSNVSCPIFKLTVLCATTHCRVVKETVTEGSLAEEYGMLKGDVIVRINEVPTTNLTHFEAHEVLVKAGNSFVLGVLRDKEVTPAGPAANDPSVCSEKSVESRPESRTASRTSNHEAPQPQVAEPVAQSGPVPAITEQQQVQLTELDKLVKDGPITDEEIAELISGEAEVLKNLNVIGVNFNRMMPKTMSLKTSAVFQTLNQEAMKTRQDLEEETKKWTTFLQKPDRPIPKPKEVVDPNRPAPYQVKIVKQPKPRVAPDRVPTPPPREPTPIPEPEPQPDYVDYIQDRTEEFIQTEVAAQDEINAIFETLAAESIETEAEQTPENAVNDVEEEEDEDEEDDEEVPVADDGSSDPVLAKQLSDVQNQLLALSQLPNTIQATLAAITQQIAHLLPPQPAPVEVKEKSKKKKKKVAAPVPELPVEAPKTKEPSPVKEKTPELIKVSPNELPVYEDHPGERDPIIISGDETVNETDKTTKVTQKPVRLSREELELQRLEEEQRTREEEWETKRQKEPAELKDDLQKELQQQLKDKPKQRPKSKQSFGGLTPQERPIFLPGGRKWRNPRDAYNEDFIAEDKAMELPVGGLEDIVQESAQNLKLCTAGGKAGQLVNFLKYQKPEKDVSFIKNSETYKMIHHLDKEPESGIEARPEKVVAEEDLRRILNANFHLHHENQLDN